MPANELFELVLGDAGQQVKTGPIRGQNGLNKPLKREN
jgi:hypothetical protein